MRRAGSPPLPSRPPRAVTSTEFIIIIALIAVFCLLFVTAFGKKIAEHFRTDTDALGTGGKKALKPDAPDAGGINPNQPKDGGDPKGGGTDPAGGVDPKAKPGDGGPKRPEDLSPDERKGKTFIYDVPGGKEIISFDDKGNKIFKASAKKVEAKANDYDAALFAGKGTVNFCNGSTYDANVTLGGAKGEAKGPGVNFGGSQKERELGATKNMKGEHEGTQNGEPSIGIDIVKVGGEVVGARLEGS